MAYTYSSAVPSNRGQEYNYKQKIGCLPLFCRFSNHVHIYKLAILKSTFFLHCITVNQEYFVVKIFSDSLAYAKIKHMRIIISNAVWGRLSKNYLTQKFIMPNIFGTKHSRFTVYICDYNSTIIIMPYQHILFLLYVLCFRIPIHSHTRTKM